MSVRELVRGTVGWDTLEAVGQELASRYDREYVRIEFLEAENWLSIPCVVDRQWFVKIITPRNAFVHAVFTGARNIGAFSSGSEGFFEHFEDPGAMARHELDATRQMRAAGVNAPAPIEAFEVGDVGVVVLDYLDGFQTLDELSPARVREVLPDLFAALSAMHHNELTHGDLRAENVLVLDDEVYFIDATAVRKRGIPQARAYDLACALGTLEPLVGAADAVDGAVTEYGIEVVLQAVDFLDFVNIRPDHDFDAAAVKGEINTIASDRPS
ncbi:RIO1 family regulatory kinase/ATPase [Halodesulfurarchaeum sp. HSR-GB]|uniref:RIO1 family regulatory kinase/ATPase domain-containing protein n=1 Tax=Halodesulfurarchaeum sp. HSR-GB TaxID=3074077 RepID=UPI0028590AD4|nr:RIO1 family regulatory kinase/ATPase [Halodesulfurarchaeum sp. HSR-GB]MDR5657109.1 RIO1 family regulatory kinase/ATPase [Halodesulfurarchaeum sp. HSR-GB]